MRLCYLTPFEKKVYRAAAAIPRGSVVSYGDIARVIGRPKAWRAVGNALHQNPFRDVPCHRVVSANGALGGYARGIAVKRAMLRREGVRIKDGRVDRTAFLSPSLG
jgi:O-6-methylguanine DNA methyltransferase